MDAHPVPQNVTSFQFHLVGDMTLKQFGYLATGLGTAYLAFIFLYPVSILLAAPVILFGVLFGVSFAFVPILDRPLDHWVKAYFRAVFSPTKRAWRSPVGGKNQFDLKSPLMLNRLQLYLHPNLTPQVLQQPLTTIPTPQPQKPVEVLEPKPTEQKEAGEENLPTDEQLKQTVELAKKAQEVQVQIVEAEKEINQIKIAAIQSGADQTAYNRKLQDIFTHLQSLILQAQGLSRQISELNEPKEALKVKQEAAPKAAEEVKPVIVKTPEIRVVEAPKAKKTELLLTSTPNVINGIITDSNGGYLENVVVVIHDHNGLPVRASKTNKLGQFAGATPLPSGEYTVTLEKDNLEFDVFQISLKDEVLAPLHILPKKGAVAK